MSGVRVGFVAFIRQVVSSSRVVPTRSVSCALF